ncbi:MAG: putative rane protein [Anaerocolumna sp.]|jgi:stage III sporulation protein AF|nr:putative rane protein [Anaerocolumna sp.]
MEIIYEWVRNIVIFLVLTTIIGNLLGKSSYKKYINLITGIILVLLVISPLLRLFQLEDSLDYYLSTNFFQAEANDYNGRLVDVEQNQMTSIIAEYKNIIYEQVDGLLKSQGLYLHELIIVIDEEETSEDFGKLKTLDVITGYQKENEETTVGIMDKIIINEIKIGDKEEEVPSVEGILSPDEINAKNLLSDFYNMQPDNINISIQE